MRHRNEGRKLSRNTSHRRALLRNLVTSLLEHGRLMTTLPKAKEIRPLAEKMITLGKRDNLHARRQVHSYLLKDATAKKVFDTIAPKFADRKGRIQPDHQAGEPQRRRRGHRDHRTARKRTRSQESRARGKGRGEGRKEAQERRLKKRRTRQAARSRQLSGAPGVSRGFSFMAEEELKIEDTFQWNPGDYSLMLRGFWAWLSSFWSS